MTNVISDAANGKSVSQPFFSVWGGPETEYGVAYVDLSTAGTNASSKKIFDIYEKGIVTDIGKITGQKDSDFQGNPGRQFDFIAGGKANYSGKIRMILAHRRLYQIEVIFLTGNPHAFDFNLFLSSFSLLDQPT